MSTDHSILNPAASFEPYRRRLLGLAYRMLGSIADAEDAVQETYLRWHKARDNVSDARAFLMATTTRICLDMLTSARARHEEYVGPWLPEPVVDTAALAPDSRTELAEDLSIALLLTLDRLSPLERAAFLLHDVFDFSFSEVASALDCSEAACRQLASRARAHVRAIRPRGASSPVSPKPGSGEGGRPGEVDAKHAQPCASRPLTTCQVVIVESSEGVLQTSSFEIDGEIVRALYIVRNPDKLRHLASGSPGGAP